MPIREIKKKFTFSEMAIMSWRSKEMSAAMRSKRPHKESSEAAAPTTDAKPLPDYGLQHRRQPATKVVEHEDSYELPQDINNGVKIPKQFFDDEGDLNLSKTTGHNAVRYLNAIGLNIPTVFK